MPACAECAASMVFFCGHITTSEGASVRTVTTALVTAMQPVTDNTRPLCSPSRGMSWCEHSPQSVPSLSEGGLTPCLRPSSHSPASALPPRLQCFKGERPRLTPGLAQCGRGPSSPSSATSSSWGSHLDMASSSFCHPNCTSHRPRHCGLDRGTETCKLPVKAKVHWPPSSQNCLFTRPCARL